MKNEGKTTIVGAHGSSYISTKERYRLDEEIVATDAETGRVVAGAVAKTFTTRTADGKVYHMAVIKDEPNK